MKIKKYFILVALIFLVMAFLRGNVKAEYNMVEYICSLNQGDWWEGLYTYSWVGGPADGASGSYSQKLVINGTELFNGVETIKRETLVNESVESYYCVALDSEGFKLYKEYQPATSFYFIFDPPSLVSPATFDVGDVSQSSWSVLSYSIATDAHVDTSTASGTVSFESVEDVTVPYGTFEDCLKISTSSSSQSPTSDIATELEDTSWFAHKVGRVKQELTLSWYNVPELGDMVLTSTWELTDFDVNFADGCPITFALGGTTRENDLNTLRRFRDKVLSKTPQGQEIIRLYYDWSPVIVKAMEENEEFREEVKNMIDGILPLIRGDIE